MKLHTAQTKLQQTETALEESDLAVAEERGRTSALQREVDSISAALDACNQHVANLEGKIKAEQDHQTDETGKLKASVKVRMCVPACVCACVRPVLYVWGSAGFASVVFIAPRVLPLSEGARARQRDSAKP